MDEQQSDQHDQAPVLDVIDSIYAVAIDPDRHEALIDTWLKRLEASWQPDGPLPEPLVEHIRKAIELHGFEAGQEPANTIRAEVVKTQGGAAMAVDADHRIVAANADAVRLYGIETGALLRALPFDEQSNKILAETVASAFAGSSEHVLRLVRGDNARTVLLSLRFRWQKDGEECVVLRTSDVAWSESLDGILQEAFKLTAAEVAVIRLLSEGATLPEISDVRGATVATIRAQFRNIYEKTETHSQVELVRMVMGLALSGFGSEAGAPVASETKAVTTPFEPSYPRADQRHVFWLPGKRKLGYARFGAESDRVVLMLHDPYFGDVWPASMVDNATRRGLNILVPARPYFGETDPFPPNVNHFEQFADDVARLLDHLRIDSVVLLTRAWGANFMLSVHDRLPDHIRGVVGVSAGVPMKSSKTLEETPGFYRFFVKLRYLANPLFLEFITRLHVGQIKRKGVDWYRDQYVEGSPGDARAMESPALRDVFAKGLAFGSGHGHRAVFNDLRQEPADAWRRSLAIMVPAIGFYGSEDPLPRLEISKALAEAHPCYERRVIEGIGQLLFFSHPDLVLQAIEDMFARNDPPADQRTGSKVTVMTSANT